MLDSPDITLVKRRVTTSHSNSVLMPIDDSQYNTAGTNREQQEDTSLVIRSGHDDSSVLSRYSQMTKRENRKQESVFSYALAM